MTAFTRLGSSIWDWEPWTELGATARVLWLALYTSAEAKRHVPGLWHGGIPTMADAARMAPDDVISALDVLLDRDMVEYDRKSRVLRLCELPDAGEFPNNGNVLRSWWTRFKTVPACPVRDSHVTTIAWLCHEGSKRAHKEFSAHHHDAWKETFGTIVVPAPRRRGVRRLADSDTSTQVQPSLFGSPSGASESGNGSEPQGDAVYPQVHAQAVDNSAALHQQNKISDSETVPRTVWGTNRIPDLGSRIPDLSSPSGEGGSGEGHGTSRPVLTLVPPYTAAEVIRELASGNWDPASDRTHQNALSALIPGWVAAGITLADLAILREYSVHARERLSASYLAGCTDMASLMSKARRVIEWRDIQVAQIVAQSKP